MKKWYLIAGILVAMLLATGCVIVNPASPMPQPGKLVIVSHDMAETDSGVEVEAVVKNAGSNMIDFAEVTVRFYDAGGTLIETKKDAVMNLRPGESWTFTITCSGAGCDRVKRYDVEAVAGTSSGGLP